MAENGGNRADMVEAARKFMQIPKIRETSFENQRQFLIGKGVTDGEIEEARASIPEEQRRPMVAGNGDGMVGYGGGMERSTGSRVVSLAQSAVVLGSISYAGYRFVRSYVMPKYFDIPDPATQEVRMLQTQVNDLQNSIKFIMDSVAQTTQQLASQQAEITKALYSLTNRDSDLNRLENGISTIKSLLLNTNNFAPIVTPMASSIPSWQQQNLTSSSSMTKEAVPSGYTTPPVNFQEEEDQIPE